MADDLGYGDVSCLNEKSKIPTPCMDRLASEGIRCTDAHSASAVCTPTRYGILTGRYCWRTRLKSGVLNGYSPPLIEPGRMTVASLLKEHGYATACIGKWHLGLQWATRGGKPSAKGGQGGGRVDFSRPISDGPRQHGFDYFFGIAASLDMPPYVYIENDRAVAVPTEITREGGREGLTAKGFKAIRVLPDLTEKAVQYIARQAKTRPGRPFFLYLPLTSPHTPIVPNDSFGGKSRAGKYGDFVAETDWSVGEVLKALEQHGLAQNTLVIVTSDNGPSPHGFPLAEERRYDHRAAYHFRGRKSDAWDGGHRIPFIARWPGRIAPGTASDEVICLNDLLTTSAAIVGARLPEDAGEDSYNILPALLGEKRPVPIREATIHHSISGMFAIRQGPWKLILGKGSGGWSDAGPVRDNSPGQLYQMSSDVSEQANLYAKHPEIVARLTALLEKYKKEGRSAP